MARFLACVTLVLCLFSFPTSGAELDPVRVDWVAHSKYWLRLLQYSRTFPFWRLESRVDGTGFFFAPDGDSDPKAELLATVEAFSKDIKVGKYGLHPQCAFPERYRYLKSELGLNIQDVDCPKFQDFIRRFNPQSATLVFSSAYPNNPGSMFGHTFLRINSGSRGNGEKKLDLLDQGISYAAYVSDDENGFAFAILGIFGGYRGQYSMVPYYQKVNEYIHAESRDLWEYDLNLTPDETRRMLANAWEVETNAHFNYYFFDENCAYVLLSLLEVAKPEWDLVGHPVHMTPADSVKRLVRTPGAVRSVHFRPSLRKVMLAKQQRLTKDQKGVLQYWLTGTAEPSALVDAQVADAAAAYLYYVKQRDGTSFSDKDKALLLATLKQRSRLGHTGENDEDVNATISEKNTQPDIGHDTNRVGLSGGGLWNEKVTGSGEFFQDLSFKFALHDLLNNDAGYTRYQQIDFPGATIRYRPGKGIFRLEQLNFVTIASLFPFTTLEKRPSWKAALDITSPKDLNCGNCNSLRLQGGAGAAVELGVPALVLYGILGARFELSTGFREGYRILPWGELSLIWNPWGPFKSKLGGVVFYDPIQKDRQTLFHQLDWEQSLSLNAFWELRSGVQAILPTRTHMPAYREAKLAIHHYF